MRSLKRCSICLIALATAACAAPATDNSAGNEVNAASPSEAEPPAGSVAGNGAAPVAANAAASDDTYRASGIEPFWALTVGGGQMVYDSADGPDITVATPAQQPTRNGYRYVTEQLSVEVTHRRCTNPMSGENFPDTVHVRAGSQTVRGCGGEGGGVP